MKKATSAFDIDNGTVYEGQVLPDGHPAVLRNPDKFTDVDDREIAGGQPPASPVDGEPGIADQTPADDTGAPKQASDDDNPTEASGSAKTSPKTQPKS
jgi:hypothetical protein